MLTKSLARRRSIRTLSIFLLLNLFNQTLASALEPAVPELSGSAARIVNRGELPGDTVTGTLAGRVIDQAGNPIDRVLIRVTNLDTGNQRATLTNSEGRYLFALLPLGRYSIETSRAGLVVITPAREPIKLQLNKTLETLPDIVMGLPAQVPPATPAPAPVAPVAPVEESTGRLTTLVDATRRANLDQRLIEVLPLGNIRSFDDLATLAAGVFPSPEVKGVAGPGLGPGIGTPGQFAVNGMRARSNNFTVDGSDNNDEDVGVRRQGFTSLVPQSIESVREIQIVSHLWDAEQGRSSGSQVNAVSRAGTNQVHGALYDYFNHDSLNARNFFDLTSDRAASYQLEATVIERFENGKPVNARRIPVGIRPSTFFGPTPIVQPNPAQGKDQYQRNQGGGVIGFPIRRNQTFFFGSFEHQQVRSRQESHFSVPTIAQRGFLNFGASGFAVNNPNGTPLSYTPTFTAGDAVFSLFPFPNNPVGPYGENTFTRVLPADARGVVYSLRLDHNFRLPGPEVTHNFTARYNFTDDQRVVPAVGGALFSGVRPDVQTRNLSLFLNSQLRPNLANQLRLSYGRTRLRFSEVRDPYLLPSGFLPGEPYLLNAPLISNATSPDFQAPFVDYRSNNPGVNVEGSLGPVGQVVVSPFSPVGLDSYLFPQSRQNNTFQFADTLTLFQGLHTVKAGADIRRTQLNSLLNRGYRPQVFFGGSPDLTCLFENAPIREISQFGPNPSPKPGNCLQPGYFSGSDLAALGIPTGIFQSLAIGDPDSTIGLRFWQQNYFINENWRARPGLTLDFGLRYELNTVPEEVNRRIERTFTLDALPAADSSYQIAAPFTNGQRIFDNAKLAGSFEQSLAALRGILGGRRQIFRPDRNNFNAHVSFAWDPLAGRRNQSGRTVIRGGIGVTHDVTLGSIVSQSRNVFPTFIPYNVDVNTFAYAQDAFFLPNLTGNFAIFNPRFVPFDIFRNGRGVRYGLIRADSLNSLNLPEGVLRSALGLLFNPAAVDLGPSGGGLAFTLPDNNLRSPQTFQSNLQVEREFGGDWLINLAWVGTRGVRLTRFRTPNGGPNSITLPVNPIGIGPKPILAAALAPLGYINGRMTRPEPGLGSYTIFDSSAASTYHSFQTTLSRQFSRGYQLTAAYTWSHAIDDVSDIFDLGGASALPQDDRDLRLERASAGFDIRHRFTLGAVGRLPFLSRFDNERGVGGRLLGGWQWATIATIQTGQPFTVNTSYDVNLDGNLTDRIDTLTGLTVERDGPSLLQLAGSPLTLLAGLGTNGRVARNAFRAPGVYRTDVSLSRNIRLRGDHYLTFRVEAFNLFNRTHFAIPVRVLEAPSFGRSVNTLVNPRQIQFALKYAF